MSTGVCHVAVVADSDGSGLCPREYYDQDGDQRWESRVWLQNALGDMHLPAMQRNPESGYPVDGIASCMNVAPGESENLQVFPVMVTGQRSHEDAYFRIGANHWYLVIRLIYCSHFGKFPLIPIMGVR